MSELTKGQTILDTRDSTARGITLKTNDRWAIEITLNDGEHESSWHSDAGTHPGTLTVDNWHHVAVIIDGGPKIISFVVDGILNDGGPLRQYGWGRYDKSLGDVNGAKEVEIAPSIYGELKAFRVYSRSIKTSEAVGNYRAELRMGKAQYSGMSALSH